MSVKHYYNKTVWNHPLNEEKGNFFPTFHSSVLQYWSDTLLWGSTQTQECPQILCFVNPISHLATSLRISDTWRLVSAVTEIAVAAVYDYVYDFEIKSQFLKLQASAGL